MAQSKAPEFPLEIKKGSAVAKIYRTPNGKYDGHTVVVYVDGKRKAYYRAALHGPKGAITLANEKLKLMNEGNLTALRLDPGKLAMMQRAEQIIAPIGKTIETIATEALEMWKILKDHSAIEACKHYVANLPRATAGVTVEKVVEELISAKEQDQLSDSYIIAINQYLRAFKKQFQGDISVITGQQIDEWLRKLAVGPRSRNNHRVYVQTLFNFAKSRGYLPRNWDEMSVVSKAKARIERITIFSPDELSRLISVAGEDDLPFIVIGAFAGIRHEEIKRLEWSNIRWDAKYIEVNAQSSKVSNRRLAPLPDNLLQWLLPYRIQNGHPRSGSICPYVNMAARVARVAEMTIIKDEEGKPIENSGVKWKKNALRHSFISYRLADIKHIGQVAEEAGNSPAKIKTNYRELVTEDEAKRWFNILPGENVTEVVRDLSGNFSHA